MGLLRVFLALTVVLAHMGGRLGPYRPISGAAAVQAFYVISGFYIALVLSEKYGSSLRSTVLFWQNRYLRLAPTYWVVMFAALGMAFWRDDGGELARSLPLMSAGSAAFVAFANVAIFGQDATSFLGFSPELGEHSLHFVSKIVHNDNPLLSGGASHPAWHFLLVPQAWSVAVELMFYAVAPALVRLRSKTLAGLMLGSLALRVSIYSAGFHCDPWTYRFFPTELVFFLAGVLSFRLYQGYGWSSIAPRARFAALLFLAGLVIAAGNTYAETVFLVLLPLLLPVAFETTRHALWDARLAELSYPLYICHSLTLAPARHFGAWGPAVALALSLGCAAVLVRLIERPINRYRQSRVKRLSRVEAVPQRSDLAVD